MTPQDRRELNELRVAVTALQRVLDVSFIEELKRRLDIDSEVSDAVGRINIGDLNNVDTTGVTNNQVLKYNDSNETWEPANDIDT